MLAHQAFEVLLQQVERGGRLELAPCPGGFVGTLDGRGKSAGIEANTLQEVLVGLAVEFLPVSQG